MKFWLPRGGSFFNDFSTLKISLYTTANEVVEVYWFHHSCLSVHLSVRLRKSGFCTITPLPFDIQWWYFTYMLTLTRGGLCWFWVKRSKVKFGLNFLPFPHHSSIYFWHTIMILHHCIDLDLRRTSIDFGVKGLGHIWSLNFVSFPHDIHLFLAYNNDTSQMYWPWPEKDLSRFGVNRLKIKVKFGF